MTYTPSKERLPDTRKAIQSWADPTRSPHQPRTFPEQALLEVATPGPLNATLRGRPKPHAFALPQRPLPVGEVSEEGLPAEWAGGFVAGCEPFVQAGWMELLLACSTGFFGKRIVEAMNDWKADHAVFNALKAFVHIVLPQRQAFHNASVLMGQVGAQLQHPVPPLLHGHPYSPPTLHCDAAQRVIGRQLDHQLDDYVLDGISSHHFSSSSSSFNRHAIKQLCTCLHRRYLLSRKNAADVLACEPIHDAEQALLTAVPPQPDHRGQVLQRHAVDRASQVRDVVWESGHFSDTQLNLFCEEGLGLLVGELSSCVRTGWIFWHEPEQVIEQFI